MPPNHTVIHPIQTPPLKKKKEAEMMGNGKMNQQTTIAQMPQTRYLCICMHSSSSSSEPNQITRTEIIKPFTKPSPRLPASLPPSSMEKNPNNIPIQPAPTCIRSNEQRSNRIELNRIMEKKKVVPRCCSRRKSRR